MALEPQSAMDPTKEEPLATPYELILEGNGISLKRRLSEATALRVIGVVMGTGGAPTGAGRTPTPPASSGIPATSLREYLDGTEAKGNPEKIVAIGQFLIESGVSQVFSRDDIKSRFRDAGERPPANFARDFGLAISAGWIAEDLSTRGQYYITKTGANAAATHFSDDVQRSLKQARRTYKRPRKSTTHAEQVKSN